MNSIKIYQLFLKYFLVAAVISSSNGKKKPHECERTCRRNDERTCEYHFEVEKFSAMSPKACYECPFNSEDCYREDCIPLDGEERIVTVIDRKLPADAIHICDGDSVEITVHNMMSEEITTIHWHGIHQKKTPFMDGAGILTQCLIYPMMSFKYSFDPDPPGTHMFHAHTGLQKAEGLFGGFVVRKPREDEFYKDLYDEDLPEHLIVVHDWTHESSVEKYIAHYQGSGDNNPDTILINGKGMFRSFKRNHKKYYTPVTKFTVKQGFRYRMRVINLGILYCPIEMMIDNHKMLVINTDGADIDTVEADSLVTTSGERWDFILNAKEDIGNYWMKFKGLADCDANFKSAFNVAVLHYEKAPNELPKSIVTYAKILPKGLVVNKINALTGERNCLTLGQLKSVNKEPTTDPALGRDFERIFFAFDFYAKDNPIFPKQTVDGYNLGPYKKPSDNPFSRPFNKVKKLLKPEKKHPASSNQEGSLYRKIDEEFQRRTPQINHISMRMPSFPPLTQPDDIQPDTFCDENQNRDCTKEFCWCTYLKAFPLNKVVELVLVDEGEAYLSNHPFHLHGYYCRVVAMQKIGDNITVEKVKQLIHDGEVKYNLIDPIYKDTWTVPRGGFTIVRCFLNNPGYWLLHCHLDFHAEIGMSVILKVGEDKIDIPRPPKNFPVCRNFN